MGGYKVIPIDESTWALDEGMVRSYLLAGTERAMLIDTGNGAGDLASAVRALTDKPVMLVNTHADPDHIGCNDIISAIVGRNDYVICDRDNHASIYDGCKLSYGKMLRYKHNDMADLELRLKSVPETAGILIVTDGVFSMGADLCNLPEICSLARKYGARVMVDDAHALGVIGEGGRGTASYFGLEDQVDIYMGTFSKSLASLGGYAAGPQAVIDYIRHNSRPFMFAASITPSSCAVALAALRKLEAEPERVDHLRELSDYMRDGLKARGMRIREGIRGELFIDGCTALIGAEID